jgi:hypothetical protein
MLAVSRTRPRNRLLAALSTGDFGVLQPHLQPVALSLRQELELPDQQINGGYFPDSGIASVVAVQSKETRVEVGLIGCEGMSGTSIVLGFEPGRRQRQHPAIGLPGKISVRNRTGLSRSDAADHRIGRSCFPTGAVSRSFHLTSPADYWLC